MIRLVRLGFAALLASSLLACQSKIVNVSHHPLVADATPTLEEAEAAIRTAASRRGWVVEREAKGVLVATIRRRSHLAVVEIKHDATHFDITYRSSENLQANERGYIHNNYNRWVRNLVHDISGARLPS